MRSHDDEGEKLTFGQAAIFKKALELGAGTTSAFTDKVTHLIAVTHGGPKYKVSLPGIEKSRH